MTENQSITSDWLQMHFCLSDPHLFSSKSQIQHNTFQEEKEPNQEVKNTGKALPSAYLEGKEKVHLGKTTFKRQRRGTEFYQDKYDIWHGNKQFGTLLANPRNKHTIPLNFCNVQVINNKLYEKGWLDDLKTIVGTMDATFHNFTRLDIAVDGGDFLSLYNNWMAKKIIKCGKAGVNVYVNNKRATTGFYIGKTSGQKYMKIYNKSAELNKSNKLYISRFWKLHNIDMTKAVERLELTIKNDESKQFEDIDWKRLDEPQHLSSIMKSSMHKFCDFRKPNGQTNITRMEPVQLVNWDAFKAEALPKNSTKPTKELHKAKITIKCLYEIFLVSQVQIYFDTAFEIAMNADLIEYFNKMQKHWADDMQTKMGHNKEGIIADSFITNFKSYDLGEQITIFDHDKAKEINN